MNRNAGELSRSIRTWSAWGALVACLSTACIIEQPPPSSNTPGSRGCNETAAPCNCWGYTDGSPRSASICASGFAVPRACPGYCPAGGSPYATVCTCDTVVPDSGVPRDVGADVGGTCQTLQAGVRPLGAPAFACGATGVLTAQIMADINTFWQSQLTPCACTDASCPFNAWALAQTPGYVYYRPDFLEWLRQAGGGALIGPAWMLSHESGHDIQIAASIRYSSDKARELGADCLSGYFLAWLACSGLKNVTDMATASNVICQTGDPRASGWFEPATHGTCTERLNAVQRGITGYHNGQSPLQLCSL